MAEEPIRFNQIAKAGVSRRKGDEVIPGWQDGETVDFDPDTLRENIGAIVRPPPRRDKRLFDYQVVLPKTLDGLPVVTILIGKGQSKPLGSAGTKNLTPSLPEPLAGKLKMLELGGQAAQYQSPFLASNPITGNVIDAHEQAGRTNPTWDDPVGGTTGNAFASNTAETGMTATGIFLLNRLLVAGVQPADLPIVGLSIAAFGGQSVTRLADGTFTGLAEQKICEAWIAWCRASGYGYRFRFEIDHGQQDAANNEFEVPDTTMGREIYAGKVIGWCLSTINMLKQLDPAVDVGFYAYQCASTFPSTKLSQPPVNGRPPNTSDALFLVRQCVPKFQIIGPDYAYTINDGVHNVSEGYHNRALPLAMAMYRSDFSTNQHQPVEVAKVVVTGRREFHLIFELGERQLMKSEYGVYLINSIVNGGSGWEVGMRARGSLGTQYLFEVEITSVDPGGIATGVRIVRPGSSPTPPAGNIAMAGIPSTVTVLTGGTLYNPAGGIVPIVGGDPIRPMKLKLHPNSAGVVQSADVSDTGEYPTGYPANGFTVSGGGVGASGATFAFDAIGTGLVLDVGTRYQLCNTKDSELLSGSRITNASTGTTGKALFYEGANLVSGAYKPEFAVMGTAIPSGTINYIRIAKESIFNAPIAMPMHIASADGTQYLDVNVEQGAWPVANPGTWGITIMNSGYAGGAVGATGRRYPRVITAEVADWYGIRNTAVKCTTDVDLGANVLVGLGVDMQSLNGPGTGGRVNFCTIPDPLWGLGYYDQQPCEWPLRGVYPAHNDFYYADRDPPLVPNAELLITSNASPVNVTRDGGYAADGHRAYRNSVSATVTASVVDGNFGSKALRIQRNPGDVVTSAISYSVIMTGPRIEKLAGKPITEVFRACCGADFSPAGKTVSMQVFTNSSATAAYGTSNKPAGSVDLFSTGISMTTTPTIYTIGPNQGSPASDKLIPSGTKMIGFYVQWLPTGTAVADDWVQFEQVQVEPDITYGRPFRPTPEVVDALQMGQVTLKPKAAATPIANGDAVLELTSNTSLTVKVRGTDGTVRSVALTLS